MKNILPIVSFACATLTLACTQTSKGQAYGEYQIVDPSSSVYEYNQVQQVTVYSGGVVESPTEFVDQSVAQPAMIISKDFGYGGPGTMRDHLWKDHSDELMAGGTSQDALMAMTDAQVQTLHNKFHAAEMAEFLKQNPGASVLQDSNASIQQGEHLPHEQTSAEQSHEEQSYEVQNAAPMETGFQVEYAQPTARQGVDAVSETFTDQR